MGWIEEGRHAGYKTVEGRELLAAVRIALTALDAEMRSPSTAERGKRIGLICNALELAADIYDRFGEKDRQRKAAKEREV